MGAAAPRGIALALAAALLTGCVGATAAPTPPPGGPPATPDATSAAVASATDVPPPAGEPGQVPPGTPAASDAPSSAATGAPATSPPTSPTARPTSQPAPAPTPTRAPTPPPATPTPTAAPTPAPTPTPGPTIPLGAASLTSPSDGSTLPGSTVTFTWSTVAGVYWYSLYFGAIPPDQPCPSGSFCQSGTHDATANSAYGASGSLLHPQSSYQKSGLPTAGETIYVRLYTQTTSTGPLRWRDYTFTAAGP